MFKQSIRTLRPVGRLAQRAPRAALVSTVPRFVPAIPTRALSTSRPLAAQPQQDGLDPEKVRKLTEISDYILGSANDMTAEMTTALLGTPEQAADARKHLEQYSKEVTNHLAEALGCSPADIEKVSADFQRSADKLQADLERVLQGEKGASDQFAKDLNKAADQVGSETLRLIGFSEKDIRTARDQFAQTSEQIRTEIKAMAKQGKVQIRDELRAEGSLARAMGRFARDFRRGAGERRMNKDAEKVARAIRIALDPVARAEDKYQRNTLLWLVAGTALVCGGLYGYKSSQVDPKVAAINAHIDRALDGPPENPNVVREASAIDAHIDRALDGPRQNPNIVREAEHIDKALDGPPRKP